MLVKNGHFIMGSNPLKKTTSTKTKNKCVKVQFIQWFFIFLRNNDVQLGGIHNSYGFINRMLRFLLAVD